MKHLRLVLAVIAAIVVMAFSGLAAWGQSPEGSDAAVDKLEAAEETANEEGQAKAGFPVEKAGQRVAEGSGSDPLCNSPRVVFC